MDPSTPIGSSGQRRATAGATPTTTTTTTTTSTTLSFGENNNNLFHGNLLALVARGSAIVTELYRLVDLLPMPFKHQHQTTAEQQQHRPAQGQLYTNLTLLDEIVCDFSYFRQADAFEANVQSKDELKRADETLRESYMDTISRFYLCFESVHRFGCDLNALVLELEEESYVGQSLDRALEEPFCVQLMCEAYFLLGYMLLALDYNFEGSLRERLVVSYYRYSTYKASLDANLDDTCNLVRSTGFRSTGQQFYRNSAPAICRPDNYPESYLTRVSANQFVVNLLISKLQTVDIYNHAALAFPHPDHRSAALSKQASILYVLLYFCPNTLHSDRSRMRSIIDKFFNDNWVFSVHLGKLVNLIDEWHPYQAARDSLAQILDTGSAKNLATQYNIKFNRASKQVKEILKKGWLTETSVLEHNNRILNTIRDSNVVLKWILLHSQLDPCWQATGGGKFVKLCHSLVVADQPERGQWYELLQNLAELEEKYGQLLQAILDHREARLEKPRLEAVETANELIAIFNGSRPMRWVQTRPDSKMLSVLTRVTKCLKGVGLEQAGASDIVVSLINELEACQESYLDGRNLQVGQLFREVRSNLEIILAILSVNETSILSLDLCTDFGYAWRLMDGTFTSHIQMTIKEKPLEVYAIKSICLKLEASFYTELRRIKQAGGATDDLMSVAQYYSTKLLGYMKHVLQIIPSSIFELLNELIEIQNNVRLRELPARVYPEQLRECMSWEQRHKMLELSFKISHYAESILTMTDTTIGPIKLDAKQLLEDGLRRELVRRLSDCIHETLAETGQPELGLANSSGGSLRQLASDLIGKLGRLEQRLSSYRSTIEHVQDYLCVYGLKMWQEELGRIVKFNVEQAVERIVNNPAGVGRQWSAELDSRRDRSSLHQSSKAPIPVYGPDILKSSFLVRICDQLLKATDPRLTIYDEQLGAWYERRGQREKLLDSKLFELLGSSLGSAGLNGLDQLCSALARLELKSLESLLQSTAEAHRGAGPAASTGSAKTVAEWLQLVDGLTFGGSLRGPKAAAAAAAAGAGQARRGQPASRVYGQLVAKLAPVSERLVSHLLGLGQLQLVRQQVAAVQSGKCRAEARTLYNCLEALNGGLLSSLGHLDAQWAAPSQQLLAGKACGSPAASSAESWPRPATTAANSQLLLELASHLEWAGLGDPLSKVYTLSLQQQQQQQQQQQDWLAVDLVFVALLEQTSRLLFSRATSGLVSRPQRASFYSAGSSAGSADGAALLHGLHTLLLHMDPALRGPKGSTGGALQRLLDMAASYVRSTAFCGDQQQLSLEAANMLLVAQELVRLSRLPAGQLLAAGWLPERLLAGFQFQWCHLAAARAKFE